MQWGFFLLVIFGQYARNCPKLSKTGQFVQNWTITGQSTVQTKYMIYKGKHQNWTIWTILQKREKKGEEEREEERERKKKCPKCPKPPFSLIFLYKTTTCTGQCIVQPLSNIVQYCPDCPKLSKTAINTHSSG